MIDPAPFSGGFTASPPPHRRTAERGRCGLLLETRERGTAGVDRGVAELLLDAQQAVVLGHALGTGRGAGLDLAAVQGDGQVGNGGVLGLAGAVGHHRLVAVVVRQGDGLEGLRQGADLVDLDQQGVGCVLLDALGQAGRVGDEEVVADQLDLVADLLGQLDPAVPVVLVQRILDGDDRVLVDQVAVDLGHLLGGVLAALEVVDSEDATSSASATSSPSL